MLAAQQSLHWKSLCSQRTPGMAVLGALYSARHRRWRAGPPVRLLSAVPICSWQRLVKQLADGHLDFKASCATAECEYVYSSQLTQDRRAARSRHLFVGCHWGPMQHSVRADTRSHPLHHGRRWKVSVYTWEHTLDTQADAAHKFKALAGALATLVHRCLLFHNCKAYSNLHVQA